MYASPIYYCSEKSMLKINASIQNCSTVVNGSRIWSLAAFCSLRERNLLDWEQKAAIPKLTAISHEIRSNFTIV